MHEKYPVSNSSDVPGYRKAKVNRIGQNIWEI